jgi:hypothetical protein
MGDAVAVLPPFRRTDSTVVLRRAARVGLGGSPDAAAELEISSTTRGFLPPRLTTAQRDAIVAPPDGLIVYNTTTNALNIRASSAWGGVGVTDHGALSGLADDDHAQYALLAGRPGGQTLIGGTVAADSLFLRGNTTESLGLRINNNAATKPLVEISSPVAGGAFAVNALRVGAYSGIPIQVQTSFASGRMIELFETTNSVSCQIQFFSSGGVGLVEFSGPVANFAPSLFISVPQTVSQNGAVTANSPALSAAQQTTVPAVLQIGRVGSGAMQIANGGGAKLTWLFLMPGGNLESARVSVAMDDVSSGSEDATMKFGVFTAGTMADELQLTGAALNPEADGGLDLGTSSLQFKDAYLSGVLKVDGTQVVKEQGAAVADASGGAVIDAEARTAINTLLARVRAHGLIAT